MVHNNNNYYYDYVATAIDPVSTEEIYDFIVGKFIIIDVISKWYLTALFIQLEVDRQGLS